MSFAQDGSGESEREIKREAEQERESVSKFTSHLFAFYYFFPLFSQNQIKHLATFSSDPPPAVTRLLFSREDVEARGYVKKLMREAGLRVHEDAVGNIFGVWDLKEGEEEK